MEKISLNMNPRRICYGLSRIGYTPDSAICDIVDNAVDAKAKKVSILLRKINEHANDRKLNNVKEYLIIDDGKGMSPEGIKNALELGASDAAYSEGTLSRFGLGLKSASFAQGDRLEVISATKDSAFYKLTLDLSEIHDEYFALEEPLSEDDLSLIQEYIKGSHGTIIRISKIHQNNHPSIRSTKDILKKRLGVIYYYFLKESLRITLDDDVVKPFDVLFTDEADKNGNLDEYDWDGKTTQWISHKSSYTVDNHSGVTCEIEVTQLPYPPIFELDGQDKVGIRKKYNIGAGNYGYYVYRNKRLISWAQGFDGIIPQDQCYYAFRGRILIDSSADDCFNIDVKKANLALSDEASQVIEEVSDAFKKKSKAAWKNAKRLVDLRNGRLPNQLANEIAATVDEVDDLPCDMSPTEQEDRENRARIDQLIKEYRKQLKDESKRRIRDETGEPPKDGEITEEEIKETLQGKTRSGNQIFQVSSLEDNLLWTPYYDAENKGCVRINQNHRFARLMYEDNITNRD